MGRTEDRKRRLRIRLTERDGPGCHYCGATEERMTLDRIIPGARGGPYRIDNLVLACYSCNHQRGCASYGSYCDRIGIEPNSEVIKRARVFSRFPAQRRLWVPDES